MTVLLSGCSGSSVPLVATAELCEAWYEIQICPQDKFTDETAKRVIGLNVGRRAYHCPPPPKTVKPECPASNPRIASVEPRKDNTK